MKWKKTDNGVHYLDIGQVGRYSIRRLGKRLPWAVYLNGKRILNIQPISDLELLKRQVENRIVIAYSIARTNSD